jgi:microcystin-dependent protein
MTLYKWSQTASSDATADATVNWAEGQAPSSINDSGRAMMAATAKYRDDIAGAIATGGTSTGYTLSSFQVFDTLAHMSGQMVAFTPHTTNGATVTLNVDGLGAKPLRSSPNTELLAGTLVQGTPYVATYSNSDAAWYLQNFYGNSYNVPLGAGMPYFLPAPPNSSFVFPFGQAISRVTYAPLFAAMGTTFGTGDGSTTFNLPDLRGRVLAGKDDMGGSAASRLTSTYFGGNAASLGAVGGAEKETLLTANLPPYTPAGTISNGAISISGNAAANTGGSSTGGGAFPLNAQAAASLGASQGASTFTGTAQGGTSAPVVTVQPTIICNYIIRII